MGNKKSTKGVKAWGVVVVVVYLFGFVCLSLRVGCVRGEEEDRDRRVYWDGCGLRSRSGWWYCTASM